MNSLRIQPLVIGRLATPCPRCAAGPAPSRALVREPSVCTISHVGDNGAVTTPTEALAAGWRRLVASVDRVQEAVDSPDPHRCPDAVAATLDDLYDIWEFWSEKAGLTAAGADAAVQGDTPGEVTAALVHARGAKSHALIEFGHFTDTYAATYFSHYGCWRGNPSRTPILASPSETHGMRPISPTTKSFLCSTSR